MRRIVRSAGLLLASLAWLPASGADIYVGHDASGVLVLSDTPFAGAQQTYRTPPASPAQRQAEAAPVSLPGAVSVPGAPTLGRVAGPLAADPPPADGTPPSKSFLGED
jgi:hypothetical protein